MAPDLTTMLMFLGCLPVVLLTWAYCQYICELPNWYQLIATTPPGGTVKARIIQCMGIILE